jgi:hypothetical protein
MDIKDIFDILKERIESDGTIKDKLGNRVEEKEGIL